MCEVSWSCEIVGGWVWFWFSSFFATYLQKREEMGVLVLCEEKEEKRACALLCCVAQ